jgi:hypothetical protein
MKLRNRESDVLAGALALLQMRGAIVWRCNAGMAFRGGQPIRLAPAGVCDIVGLLPGGRFIGVETKRKGGRLRPAQAAFLASVEAAGGVALLIDDLGQLDAALLELLTPEEQPR